MLSSSNATPVGLTEEVIPGRLDAFTIDLDQPDQLIQLSRIEAVILSY
jgi:hypothetical protein